MIPDDPAPDGLIEDGPNAGPWLRTERLELRRWAPEHREGLRALAALPEVVRYVGDGTPWDDATVSTKHQSALEHWRRCGYGWLSMHDRSGAAVGLVSVNERSSGESGVGVPAVELGYWVAPAAWGCGYASEATRAVVAEVFARGFAERLVARHLDANTASGRLLEKLGFVRHHVVDGLVYSVLEGPAPPGPAPGEPAPGEPAPGEPAPGDPAPADPAPADPAPGGVGRSTSTTKPSTPR
ncbi:GNAT family N-acetyltransferase [Saccharothrix sp. Mg75]|uniref:GNAT family N-acetyltransferase n=1 Tax=Saccharothrix sp. Mg75 TaxID=3445357 RepID=UPI003EEAE5BC